MMIGKQKIRTRAGERSGNNLYPLTPIFIVLYFFLAYGVSAFQQDNKVTPSLLVGTGKKNITPPVAVKNWVTGKAYDVVQDSIYVRTLALSDGGQDVVIVAWDLVDAGESATAEIRKKISAELNIPGDQILVNASHNHSAPWAPVYKKGFRGAEADTWWAIRHMPPQNDDSYFRQWMDRLITQTVKAARQAYDARQPATLWIGRTDVSEFLNNRRPRRPTWGVAESHVPQGYNYMHEHWNPDVLPGGATFGPMDRTMTLISFRDDTGKNIASVFHLSVHAVSIYPFTDAISGDWPEAAAEEISNAIGGEAIFLQGTAGDINPWKRGREAVKEMGAGLRDHAREAYQYSVRLQPDALGAMTATVGLPLNAKGRERTGLNSVDAEVQVITLGPLALVALPGEPLTDLGTAIRDQSPFPQTLVLGYSNGNGVHYVGMPGEVARGGYEMETGTVGTDEAGEMLVALAVQLLRKARANRK